MAAAMCCSPCFEMARCTAPISPKCIDNYIGAQLRKLSGPQLRKSRGPQLRKLGGHQPRKSCRNTKNRAANHLHEGRVAMPNPRISIAKIRQLIQLESSELTTRGLARALGLSQGAVCKYRRTLRLAGVTQEQAQALDDVSLEHRVWQARYLPAPRSFVLPDCARIHMELKRHKHVT